jgi:1-acyl-sn-glycerol-3-phosphate acyltransferase
MNLYNLLRPFAILIFKFFFHLKVYGRQFLPKEGGFILASNHLSNLDPVLLGVAVPRRLNFMAKEELFINPIFGLLIRILGAFPIKRNSPDLSALREAMKRLKKGGCVVIFPQGTRSPGDLKVEPGIGFLAIKTELPVIPVYIEGTDKILPKGERRISKGKITITFGSPVILKEKGGKSYLEISKDIMEEIGRLACA